MKINQLNFTQNFCWKNVSQQVAKYSQTHLFTKTIKAHVNAKQTPDSNMESLILIQFRVTLSNFVFGLPAGFFLPVVLVQHFDYFPLQSFNNSTGIQSQDLFVYHVSKFSYCVTILLNLLVNIMRMFDTQSFLVYCRWLLNTLYTVIHKL